MKQVELELMCELTDEDVQMRAQQLAGAFVERDKVDAAKREAARAFSKQLEGIDERMRRLSDAIRDRREMRFVRCAVIFHSPVVGTKRLMRVDTGELVREEAMTIGECQQFLFADAAVDVDRDAVVVAAADGSDVVNAEQSKGENEERPEQLQAAEGNDPRPAVSPASDDAADLERDGAHV